MSLCADEFEKNRQDVQKEKLFENLFLTITEVRDFIDDLGYLSFGRDIDIIAMKQFINANIVLDSTARTVESIRYCCLNSNFADAYTLLRKYRDDLFYYLYLLAVAKNNTSNDFRNVNFKIDINEKHILDWINNKQKNLHIKFVLKYLASLPELKKAILKFDLQKSFDELSNNLNNYVHSNGIIFYNRSCSVIKTYSRLDVECKNFSKAIIYISMTFVFLLALMRPLSIMSYDYFDYLDCNQVPPDNLRYWVAPFISKFFSKYADVLGGDSINYLRKETKMEI